MSIHKGHKLKTLFYLITLSIILTIIYSTPILGNNKVNNSNEDTIKEFSSNKLGKVLINYPYFKDRSIDFNDDFVSGQSFLIYYVKVDMHGIRNLYSKIYPQLNSIDYINLQFYIPTANLMKVNSLYYEITHNSIKYTDTIPSNRINIILEWLNSMYPNDRLLLNKWKTIDSNYLPTILNQIKSQSIQGIISIINHNQNILNIINTLKKEYNK